MSKAASSPTARLLQSSRLFSLPRSLPHPGADAISSTGASRSSDTATLPYPVRQAIATPASSHFRGDWGLKRPLPARANRGSKTPHVRITAHDTPEQITDFASATDHTMTSLKWKELGIPMVHTKTGMGISHSRLTSVFDDAEDHTDPNRETQSQSFTSRSAQLNGTEDRWKFSGPWIAGMQDGEFEVYLRRAIEKRQPEWRQFVRNKAVEKRVQEVQRRTLENNSGHTVTSEDLDRIKREVEPSDEELETLLKALRDEHALHTGGLASELTSMISEFLDLPGVTSTSTQFADDTDNVRRAITGLRHGNSRTPDPSSTHPSAGLSYVRTSAIMENHPIHGPQAHRAPVLARVLRPRMSSLGTETNAKLGVAGIVANDSVSSIFTPNQNVKSDGLDPNSMATRLDAKLKGGNKMWVHPHTARINARGGIELRVSRGDKEAVAVRSGDVESIHEARRNATIPPLASMSKQPVARHGWNSPDPNRMPSTTGWLPGLHNRTQTRSPNDRQ